MARSAPPRQSREVRLFRNNRSQAVRIPAEFALPGDRARITRDGDRLILEPMRKDLTAILGQLKPIDEAFPDVDEDLPPLDDVKL